MFSERRFVCHACDACDHVRLARYSMTRASGSLDAPAVAGYRCHAARASRRRRGLQQTVFLEHRRHRTQAACFLIILAGAPVRTL